MDRPNNVPFFLIDPILWANLSLCNVYLGDNNNLSNFVLIFSIIFVNLENKIFDRKKNLWAWVKLSLHIYITIKIVIIQVWFSVLTQSSE